MNCDLASGATGATFTVWSTFEILTFCEAAIAIAGGAATAVAF